MPDAQKPGATGRFPFGQLDDTDEGELGFEVRYDRLDGLVRVDFGKLVTWMAFSPEQAVQLAHILVTAAGGPAAITLEAEVAQGISAAASSSSTKPRRS